MFYRTLFTALLAVTISSAGLWMTACQSVNGKEPVAAAQTLELPELLPRAEHLGSLKEQVYLRETYSALSKKIQQNPGDSESRLKLAELYWVEARTTGNFGHYHAAALTLVDDILKEEVSQPLRFSALSLKASVRLSQHRFAKALELGEEAVTINPHNARVYGILVDANVELGNYAQAVAMADKMMEVRPDLRSYSRVSYLREIHGDVAGSIEAMLLAVAAGYPGSEELAWSRYTLGNLYLTYGDLPRAEQEFSLALAEREAYPYAQAGMASVETRKGNHDQALKWLLGALSGMETAGFYEQLAKVYTHLGNSEAATEASAKAFNQLRNESGKSSNSHGHHHETGLELATLFLHLKSDAGQAIHLAEHDYENRPANIDVNRLLANAYYLNQELDKAAKHTALARATGSVHPEILCIAGLLEIKAGKGDEGRKLLKASFEGDPFQSHLAAEIAKEFLKNDSEAQPQ